jgi:peptidylprolyl isomerase
MGTSKRERQKAGHQARVSVERAMDRRDRIRRRTLTIIGVVVTVVAVSAVLVILSKNTASTSTATATTTTSTPTTTLESVAGKPCVAFDDTLPPGAPTVAIPTGLPPTALIMEDLIAGSGEPITANDTITVNYIGVSCSTGKIFDSSWSAGKTTTFPLTQVIPGWTQGLAGMMPGGRRQLVIPPNLAYGSTGQGRIAPDETLVFVVDLVSSTPTTTTTIATAVPTAP